MRVLAIDTALEACAAAVLDTERGTLASELLPMLRGHAEALMPLIARVMRQADIPFSALDRIAVTTGPGSFTGLRVGISAARGIALAAAKPAIGLTTLAAYAAPYIAHDDKTAVAVAIDARHQHVYLQIFGPGGRTLVAPRIASVADAARAAATGAVADRRHRRSTCSPRCGRRASCSRRWWTTGARRTSSGWRGSRSPPTKAPAEPRPLYLRAPDAQPQDAARLPRR